MIQVVRLNRASVHRRDYASMRRALYPVGKENAREIHALLGRRREAAFVALVDGKPAGFCEVSLREYANGAQHSPVGFLEGWFVATAFRRQGVGRALVAAAEHWTLARGARELCSDAEVKNTRSHRAHRELGFREVERNVSFAKPLRRP